MNVYLLQEPDGSGVTVYDAGEKGMADAVARAAAPLGGIRRVVLGHADNDHRGAAPGIGAPVFCHEAEVEAAERGGHRNYWRMNELPLPVRVLHSTMMRFAWEGGPVTITGTVAEGDEIAGFRVIDLPGHAPGLIGLWRESDGVALVSDCFYMSTMYGRPAPPAVPLEQYNLDTRRARESMRKLAALDPKIVCPGHLGPLTGPNVRAQLERGAAA
jgi:glyoxylase-like metal-dependent hydrolase (beta-lactamase superfamily II)